MKFTSILLAFPRFIARENEGGDGNDSGTDSADAGNQQAAQGQENTPGPNTFTQDQVNEIVVKRNKKVREQLETAEATVEKLLATQNLSTQERAGLETQLNDLQSQLRTKEQQAAHEAAKQAAEHQAKLESATQQLTFYKDQFETQTRNNAILQAASEAGGYNPEQFVDILGPRTKIVEETNGEGVKTGRLVPRVLVIENGEDGTPTEVLKTPEEAIASMKENVEKFGNLFRGNVAKGIGEGSNSTFAGQTRVDVTKMSDEEYFKNRDAIKEQYGIRDPRV